LGLASLVALVVAGPWFVAMTVQHGGLFWEVFLGYHVMDRAEHALVGMAPLTMYVETMWALDGVLGLLLLLGLVGMVVWRRSVVSALVVGTAVVTLLAIHVSSTRLYHYVMPVVPLAAVAVAVLASRRREALIAVAVAGVLGVLTGPLDPTLLRPDFAPSSKALGVALRSSPAETRIVSWEDYDPALTWYLGRPVRIWTQSERMAAIQRSIDMMRRAEAVVLATPERLAVLAASEAPVIVVAPRERSAGLRAWATGLSPGRVEVDEETVPSHVILRLEPVT